MATNLHRALEAIRWRLEAIAVFGGKGFFYRDPERDKAPTCSRGFSVRWLSSEYDREPGTLDSRLSEHSIAIEVLYRVGLAGKDEQDAQEMLLQDRHDIIQALQPTSTWNGYNVDNSSTDIGIELRHRESDEIERGDEIWTYRALWRHIIREAIS